MSETVTTPKAPSTTATTAPALRGRVVQNGKVYFWGTGRRKTSVARVRVTVGDGKFTVNDRQVDDFFKETKDRQYVRAPLMAASIDGNVDIMVTVFGGGYTGQAGAIVQGLSRALSMYDATLRPAINSAGLLTRDSRMKERKKYGQRGARRRFQFSKR